MLGEHIVPQSEVIRAILMGGIPCCGDPHPPTNNPPSPQTCGPTAPYPASHLYTHAWLSAVEQPADPTRSECSIVPEQAVSLSAVPLLLVALVTM